MNLAYEIGSRLYRRRSRGDALSQRASGREAYWQWQYESSAAYFEKFPGLSRALERKRVLDIGCGIGGRTCYLLRFGPERAVGVDINGEEIEQAKQLADARLERDDRARVRFLPVEEGQQQVEGAPFDVVLLIDSLEHVRDPVGILNYAYDMTAPGGLCYFSTMGWYHHRASHVHSIVPIPFATLFFSDNAILDAVKRIVSAPYYRPTMWDSDPPIRRWQSVNSLHDRPGEYLNKITIRGMLTAMKQCKFEETRLHVQGFSTTRCAAFRALNLLASIPVVREVYHSACFGLLRKSSCPVR